MKISSFGLLQSACRTGPVENLDPCQFRLSFERAGGRGNPVMAVRHGLNKRITRRIGLIQKLVQDKSGLCGA